MPNDSTDILTGYKVVGHDGKRAFALYDKSIVDISPGNVATDTYLGTTRQFCEDYFTGLTDQAELLLIYNYDRKDVVEGNPDAPSGEVKVSKAVLRKVEPLEKIAKSGDRIVTAQSMTSTGIEDILPSGDLGAFFAPPLKSYLQRVFGKEYDERQTLMFGLSLDDFLDSVVDKVLGLPIEVTWTKDPKQNPHGNFDHEEMIIHLDDVDKKRLQKHSGYETYVLGVVYHEMVHVIDYIKNLYREVSYDPLMLGEKYYKDPEEARAYQAMMLDFFEKHIGIRPSKVRSMMDRYTTDTDRKRAEWLEEVRKMPAVPAGWVQRGLAKVVAEAQREFDFGVEEVKDYTKVAMPPEKLDKVVTSLAAMLLHFPTDREILGNIDLQAKKVLYHLKRMKDVGKVEGGIGSRIVRKFDTVLGHPSFGIGHDMSPEYKSRLKKEAAERLARLMNEVLAWR
jgi:hypothetical protein